MLLCAQAAFTDLEVQKLGAISAKPYKDQAQFFLNAFWVGTEYDTADGPGPDFANNEEAAEQVWTYKNAFVDLDKKDDAGNELDEFQAHIILEKFDSALTVTKMREARQCCCWRADTGLSGAAFAHRALLGPRSSLMRCAFAIP